jgi:hypothetical protein
MFAPYQKLLSVTYARQRLTLAVINYTYNDLMIDLLCLRATFSNISAISWRPVLVVEEAGVPEDDHRP